MLMNEKNCKDKELNAFLQSNTKSHYLQTAEWAQVKNNWKHEMLVVKNNEKIIGVMSVLLKASDFQFIYDVCAERVCL